MSTIELQVNDHQILAPKITKLAQGSHNYDTLKFTFDSNWSSYTKYAILYQNLKDEDIIKVPLDSSNQCKIPIDALEHNKPVHIGARGERYVSGEWVFVTSLLATFHVGSGAIDGVEGATSFISEDEYNTVVARLNDLQTKKLNKSGWNANKYLGTDSAGNIIEKDIAAVDIPVKSVNGKTGAVNLTYSDVNADKSGTATTKVSDHNTSTTSHQDIRNAITNAKSEMGTQITQHNASTSAHSDIRTLITGLTNRLDALANSDDETLDQLSEIVSYIKNNKSLIDGITTSKVNISDIIDNLETAVSNKPLSANQGVVLKQMIADAVADLTEVINNIDTEISTLTFTNVPTEDGTLTEMSYDGKSAMTIPLPDLNDVKIEVDSTLENEGMAADAHAVGVKVSELDSSIDLLDARLTELGNLVSDVTEADSGITVHYKDGTSKEVDTKDTTVKVEDVSQSATGISITYTDGTTKDIEISGGSGSSYSGDVKIEYLSESTIYCLLGDECNISYRMTATDSAGDVVGDGDATWYINDVKTTTSIASQGENTFDIGPFLKSSGKNSIKVIISVDTGGEQPISRSKTWTVRAVNLRPEWNYEQTTLNTADTVTVRWTAYGDIEKTTHFLIDGEEIATFTSTRDGAEQYTTFDRYPHGSHLAELYITATINEHDIRSNSVFNDMIFVDPDENKTVISCPIQTAKMVQYNTLKLPIVVYTPGSLTSDVVFHVNGEEYGRWDGYDRTVHELNYTPSDFGTKELTITSGDTTKTITITVEELDIDNEEIGGYAFRLKASDIASNEALRDWNSNGVTLTFSDNFDWHNGGIKSELDEDGNVRQYICVKAGTTAEINYELFGNEAKANGKSLKVIFKATNCRDRDATFLTCKDSGIGIELGANGGVVSSALNSSTIKYREDAYVEFEYDISPSTKYCYLQTFLGGVLSGTKIYASDDNFTQSDKKKILIGSDDCDVYIYMVKAYETYLSLDDHIENFIADAPNAQEMVKRYNRNDVLGNNNEISYEKLSANNPNCRIHLWDIPRMTEGKKDYVEGCTYQQIYKAGDQRHQLYAQNVTINIQGTSSVDYKDAGANTDGNFTEGFTDGNGQHIDVYSMSDNSIGVNYFNTKVNIASCENINNMCLAEWYNRYQPYKTAWRLKNENARDCMEHHIGVQFIKDQSHVLFPDDNYHMYAICNMGNSKNNSEVFHDITNPLECCIETKDNNSTHCMMLDPTFDEAALDTEDFFEFRYPKEPTAEHKNSFITLVRWFATNNPARHTDEPLESEVTFEPYTFRGTGQADEILKGLTIREYAGTYTHDTYEYRMAKMLSECEDHLIMDSMVFHYVFIEQHAMVDNVCKNTFWGTEDGVHWHLAKNYDNDTADGNNNTGELAVPFGCEGFDNLDDGAAFNGRDNVYWGFIFGLYDARQLMWQKMESKRAWDAEAYLAFAREQQNYIPERVYNQDYWYKYLRLYETKGVTTYLDMLEGGKKDHQREAFVTDNMYYMASQYLGTACVGKSITFRGYTPPTDWAGVEPKSRVSVMMGTKGYVVVQIGSIVKRIRTEKGIMHTIDFPDSGNMTDTVINIHGANLVQEVGDVSCLYTGYTDFSAATKLRSVTIGSMAEGYSNGNLTEVSFGTNKMLEEIYIQNCPNAKVSLNLSGCQALRILDIRGSGFTGITFATGGLLEKAYLPALSSIKMISLYNLLDENLMLDGYDNLTSIRIEDCPNVDSFRLVSNAENLNRLRVLDVDWTVPETALLNKLLTISGLNETDNNEGIAVITGKAFISGSVREKELQNYADAWKNFVITYDPSLIITQYLATYVNADGSWLWDILVDRGSVPVDPVALGIIPTPTLESTPQYDFEYSRWDDVETVMLEPRTITAIYNMIDRYYTVSWYSRIGMLVDKQSIKYNEEAVYGGNTLIYQDDEPNFVYQLFDGWDKSTAHVIEDMDVYARWSRAELPAAGTDISDMSAVELYGVMQADKASEYIEDRDTIEITMGHDVSFDNVEDVVLADELVLDGSTVINTGIKLFDNNDAWTIAVDMEYTTTTKGQTAVSCYYSDGQEGFLFLYETMGSNTGAMVQWAEQRNVYSNSRDMAVLRHPAGSNNAYLYTSNCKGLTISVSELTKSRTTVCNNPLVIGAQIDIDNSYINYATGILHYCKLWYADLGDTECRKLAKWIRTKSVFEYAGSRRYILTNNAQKYAGASFIARDLLYATKPMNSTATNDGGWDASDIREYMNTRCYDAFPEIWKFIIKQVRVKANDGNFGDVTTVTSNDYCYLPSLTELTGDTREPYTYEGSQIPFFIDNGTRIKYINNGTGKASEYWTRSANVTPTSSGAAPTKTMWLIFSTGSAASYYPASSSYGVCLCFSI